MRRSLLLLLLAALPARAAEPRPPAQERPAPRSAADAKAGDLYILGVAMDQQPDKAHGVDAYNWCPEEIEKVFKERAGSLHKNVHSRMVLAEKATHAGILDGFGWLREHARDNDFVVVYVGCHGFNNPDEGWGVASMDGPTLWGHEIKAELAKLPCQAIIFIETCTSGGFASPHKKDPPVPLNVTALCACSGKQTTDNPLDMAVAEALYGRADFNNDGVVDLDELIRYVQLRYREWWPEPETKAGSQTPVILKAKAMPGSLALTRTAPNLAAVVRNGVWYGALEEGRAGDNYKVHMLGWSSHPGPYFLGDEADRDSLCRPGDGRPLLVRQNDRWYPARLLNKDGDRFNVHYLGYAEDEVVTKDRIKYPFAGDLGSTPSPEVAAGPAPGAWERVGPVGGWKTTLAGAVLDGRLYTVEASGKLWATNLDNGAWQQIGNADFGNTAQMFASGGRLYTIEQDGSLYRVSPKNGAWDRVGEAGAWKGTLAGAVLRGRLYTAAGGNLYVTDLDKGECKQVGGADFGNTAFLFAAGDKLNSIEQDGNLYRIDPGSGAWERVGPVGGWRNTRAGAVLGGRLYTTETSGCLYDTSLNAGSWRQLGGPEFGATVFLFAAGDKAYTIDADGNLYRVTVK